MAVVNNTLDDHPVLAPGETYGSVTDTVADPVDKRPQPTFWYAMFGVGVLLMGALINAIGYLLYKGVGIWGINIPVGWGFAIINFVWWIGIGHAGTLISAILLLFNQGWRNSINRFAEAMTLFAVTCAGLFPVLHTGRPWAIFFTLPYPSTLAMWPQFRSPLMWDVFAITAYGTVSALFWYVGLIPDLATMRDRAKHPLAKVLYGMAALGWRGSAKHWFRYESAYVLLAGLSTPLVVSVHTIVSYDFAVSQVPGWHTTVFPPYFVAGAVFSGFAMVVTLLVPIRAVYRLENLITLKHFDNMGKVMLATGLIVVYGYALELFYGWYSGSPYERALVMNRLAGPYWPAYWALIFCNGLAPQLLWSRRIRTNLIVMFILSIVINIGMWLERFVIVVISLAQDFLPSSWDMFYPTFWDWLLYAGTFGLFLSAMFLFIRFVPMINIFEVKHLVHHAKHAEEH